MGECVCACVPGLLVGGAATELTISKGLRYERVSLGECVCAGAVVGGG